MPKLELRYGIPLPFGRERPFPIEPKELAQAAAGYLCLATELLIRLLELSGAPKYQELVLLAEPDEDESVLSQDSKVRGELLKDQHNSSSSRRTNNGAVP